MEIAIIGFPQSGKTTLFRALTRGRVGSASHGSGGQEVLAGIAHMADARLDALADTFQPEKVVPEEIKYWDVPAGLGNVGEDTGIGGQYYNVLQGADAILHVVRAFQDPSVPHTRGTVDEDRDAADMEAELAFSDLTILERRMQRIEAQMKGTKGQERDSLTREASFLQGLKEGLDEGVPVREQPVQQQMEEVLSNYQLLTGKPLLTVVNTDEDATGFGKVEAKGLGKECTSLSAKLEMELTQLAPEDELEFRESMGLTESGLDRVVRLSSRLLCLVSFFTYVSKEVRAWTVAEGTPAVKAAGRIHSDMERGFIRAEVVSFDDLAACGSVAQCKKQGLVRLEGKGYPVKDGDVITFLFNI